MASRGNAQPRAEPLSYKTDIERLCGYIKNDSIIRWHLGCTQAQVDEARALLAKRRPLPCGPGYLPPSARNDEMAEERQREKRAKASNKAYLRAIAKADREAQKGRAGERGLTALASPNT